MSNDDSTIDSLLMENVSILPMDTPRILDNQSLLVKNGLIAAIGNAGVFEVPADTRVIDGGGGFLMPDLSDMHAHIRGYTDDESITVNADIAANQFLLYLATGATAERASCLLRTL